MNTKILIIATAIVLFAILLFAIFKWTDKKPKPVENQGAKNLKRQVTDHNLPDSNSNKRTEKHRTSLGSADEWRNALDRDMNRIRPGSRVGFSIDIQVFPENGDLRRWEGNFVIRCESQWSTATVRRNRPGRSSGSTKETNLVSRQYGTGLLTPRRWILVGNNFVEGAKRVTVVIDGVEHDAEIRRRLPKTGFATLQIAKAKFPKIPVPEPSNERLKTVQLAWLDSDGKLQIQSVKTTSYTSYQGGSYGIRQALPDNCVGAVAFDEFANVKGFIADTVHPSLQVLSESNLNPISRVVKSWNGSKDIFAPANSTLPKPSIEEAISKRLVQVLVERPVQQDSPFLFFVVPDISARQAASGLKAAFHQPKITYKEISYNEVDPESLKVKPIIRQLEPLPFYLGNLLDQVLFAFEEPIPTQPLKISRLGLSKSRAVSANGTLEISNLFVKELPDQIEGKRRLTVRTEKPEGLNGKVDMSLDHQFTLSKSDLLPLDSKLEGSLKLESSEGVENFDVKLSIKRL